jgi:hypothetical protein
MNISYAKSVLTRAIDAAFSSGESAYKEIMDHKITAVQKALCEQEGVSEIYDLDLTSSEVLRKELSPELTALVADLDISI